ncbi:MAG: PEP-CTERM sorting domain-containing protein [Opitutales bacterium]
MTTRSASILFAVAAVPAFAQINFTQQVNNTFADSSGTHRSGMSYGILIDTQGDGYALGKYTGFDLGQNGQFLPVGESLSNDWFLYPGLTPPETFTGLGEGTISNIEFNQDDQLTVDYVGLSFGILWFESDASVGASYGFAADDGFTIIEGTGAAPDALWEPGGADLVLVPEPSALPVLLGLGGVVLAVRRRRR